MSQIRGHLNALKKRKRAEGEFYFLRTSYFSQHSDESLLLDDSRSIGENSKASCSSEDKKLPAKKLNTSNDNSYPAVIFPHLDLGLQKTRVVSIIYTPSGFTTTHVDIPKNRPSANHFVVMTP